MADGARRLTTTRVAARAGVSVGTLYQYFPNKEALLCAVIERYLDQVADAVERACDHAAGQPLQVAAEALVFAYVEAKGRDAEASRALYAASSELEVTGLVTGAFDRFQAATVRLLGTCPDAEFEDIDQVAFSLLAALTGATRVFFEGARRPRPFGDFRQRMSTLANAFLRSSTAG